MRLWFWSELDGLLQALPAGWAFRSVRLRRLRRWVLVRFVMAAADDLQRMAARRVD